MLAGLISNLHSFEAVRCIGWSVSVVYKVRDHDFGDPGVMEKMLASRMGMGILYLPSLLDQAKALFTVGRGYVRE